MMFGDKDIVNIRIVDLDFVPGLFFLYVNFFENIFRVGIIFGHFGKRVVFIPPVM